MHRSSLITTIALAAAVAASDAEARLDVYVDKSTQQLSVIQNGSLLYVWPISTGRDRHSTPSGIYRPERLEQSWFSKAYYNSPMPYAIFFHNGYAIHGSYAISKLGGPASHGCVRLHPRDAALLYALVEREGAANTAIFIEGNSNRSSLRYRNFHDLAQPAYPRNDSIARSAPPGPMIPPGGGADRYADGTGAYSPPGPRMSPDYSARYVDGRSAYPPGPDSASYYYTDRYIGEGRSVPPGPRVAFEYNVDPYIDARGARQGPRAAPDYNVDPYAGGRGAPRGPNVPPSYDPDRHGGGRGAYSHDPRTPRYYSTDRYTDGPARRRGDQFTVRGNYPVSRPPAPLLDGEAPVERTSRSSLRPVTPRAKSRTGRFADEPPSRPMTGDEAAKAPPMPAPLPAAPQPAAPWPAAASWPAAAPSPAPPGRPEPQPEQQQPSIGYHVLPRSYWAGASWRWRIRRGEDGPPHDSQ